MDWTPIVRAALTRHRSHPDENVVLELAQHAYAAWRAALAEGVAPDRAEVQIRSLVDGWCQDPAIGRRPARPPVVEPPRTTSRGAAGGWQDVRYGVRLIRRQPGAAAITVLVTALGIGAAATLFSLVYGVLLRPLPWPDADRLVQITESREGATRQLPNVLTNATYLAWRDQPATLESLAAFSDGQVTLTGTGEAERVRVAAVTASLFSTLRVAPLVGTTFREADEAPNAAKVVVLSYGLWQRRFGGRADIVGQPIELNGVPHTITGVMPRTFFFPDPGDVAWRPYNVPPVLSADPDMRSLTLFGAIARLGPGVTTQQADAEGTARCHAAPDLGLVGIAVFGTKGAGAVHTTPYLAAVTADVRPALIVLFIAVGLLLVAAVANIAGVQLARAVARRREVAIRSALGAGSARLSRQLLTENLLVGVAGGVLGLLLAAGLHRVLPAMLPADFPRLNDVAIDWRVAAFSLAAAVLSSLAFGVMPAAFTRRLNLVEALTEDSLAPVGGSLRTRVSRARASVMVGQVAIAAMLLVGALLLMRSFVGLLRFDRGFDAHNLLTVDVPLPNRLYTSARRAAFVDSLIERLQKVPGVTHAAATTVLPLTPRDVMMGFRMPPSAGTSEGGASIQTSLRVVSADYFAAMGVRVLDGRGFEPSDTIAAEHVAVVNRTFVRRYINGSPFSVRLPVRDNEQLPIVGVVEDVHGTKATDPAQPELYLLYDQSPKSLEYETPTLVVRTAGDPNDLVGTLRSLVREQDPSVALQSVMTMDARLGTTLAKPRLYAVVLGAFAGFALLVSGLGLFGVLSYSVAQRSREIGVRSALGATPRHIAALVLRQGLTVTLAGIAIGLAAAFVLARNLGALLYGVAAADPMSFAVVPVTLVIVSALACYPPARRAARVDPLSVLKGQ